MMSVLEKALLALVVVFCAALTWEAWAIKPPAWSFPVFTGVLTAALAGWALVHSRTRPMGGPIFSEGSAGTVMAGMAGLVGYVLLLRVSYLAATPVFLFLGYLYLLPERTLRSIAIAAIIAVATTGFTWLCFAYWLGVDLP
ncbi:tripartite tricarboxylate transporter TctB family protein [Marinovum sp.]|uniref:tripartite tricarboxylate transporter TctB family protein n=1 Tax=Marinovum sp. TaxID=2024839 RepID=UPI002B26EFAA|nr:tripartite tricarboxylate transporter TctB family protein [Marinovum sp.]